MAGSCFLHFANCRYHEQGRSKIQSLVTLIQGWMLKQMQILSSWQIALSSKKDENKLEFHPGKRRLSLNVLHFEYCH
jgi:hypothetical protein